MLIPLFAGLLLFVPDRLKSLVLQHRSFTPCSSKSLNFKSTGQIL